MRILRRDLPRMVLLPECLDDLWHLEKVLEQGDLVTSRTERRFKTEAGDSERKNVTITIRLDSFGFYPTSSTLRLLGVIEAGKPIDYISLGSHHTIEAKPGTRLTLEKQAWKKYQLDRLKQAVASIKKTKLLIIALDDETAELATLRDYAIESKGTIYSGKTGKRFVSKDPMPKYFAAILGSIQNFSPEKVVVAGPGFTKESFQKHVLEKDPATARKMTVASVGMPGHAGIQEILKKDTLYKILENERVVQETKAVEAVLEGIAKQGKTAYGLNHVKEALDFGAVEMLVVTDSRFSKSKGQVEPMLDQADKTRAKVHIVSKEHEAGKKLDGIGGIAATLRFEV